MLFAATEAIKELQSGAKYAQELASAGEISLQFGKILSSIKVSFFLLTWYEFFIGQSRI